MGQLLLSEYGGPDGEIGASMRYLSQRYSMENRIAAGTLTDIGISVLGGGVNYCLPCGYDYSDGIYSVWLQQLLSHLFINAFLSLTPL